jgi:hypothetical protein
VGHKVNPEKAALDWWEGERNPDRRDRDPELEERWLSAREMLFEPVEEAAPVFAAMWKTAVSHDERIWMVDRFIGEFPASRVFQIFPWLRDAVAIDPDLRDTLEANGVPLQGIDDL